MRMRTINEAAAELNIPRQRIQRGIDAGRYPAMQWGNRRLVDMDVLLPLIAAEKEQETIGIRECAQQLGLSADVLRRMTCSGLIPHERRGRYYRFRLKEVEAAIQAQMKDGDTKDDDT